MPSQFFGLTIAGSGITAYQAAINATANNIANVQKEGYSRQKAYINSADALRVNTRYGSIGAGVSTDSVKQLRDEYYDRKYWENQSRVGYYENKLYYMSQVENYFIDDDTITGFTALMMDMDNSLNELKANNADETERKAFISKCKSLTNYFNNVANELQGLQSGINDQIKTTVENINSILQKVALLNKEINVIEIQGGYANELRDERNLLADELTSILPVEISEVEIVNSNDPDMYLGAHDYTIKLQGQYLVDGYTFNELECVAREKLQNQSDTTGLYDIRWKGTGVTFNPYSNEMDGELKALFEMRDGNNNANFQEKLTRVDADPNDADARFAVFSNITVESFQDVYGMNMPEQGTITINNHVYEYDGFSYKSEINADGSEKITEYKFHITNGDAYLDSSAGKASHVGEAVDCLGVPYYQNQLNAFLRSYTQKFNNIEESGLTLDEEEMGAFFVGSDRMSGDEVDFTGYSNTYKDGLTTQTYGFGSMETTITTGTAPNQKTAKSSNTYYQLTAFNVGIADASIKNSNRFATTAGPNGNQLADGVDQSDLTMKLLDLYDSETIVRGTKAKDFLQCIIDDVSVDTEETKTFVNNYNALKNVIQTQRDSVSGVDQDEEALDLIKFQNAYNLSSKVIQILTEIYDRLILETGV